MATTSLAFPDTATPTLSVLDPRGLAIRNVAYCRQRPAQTADARITRQTYEAAGRLVASWDPRLWGSAPKPNIATIHGLSGQPLLTDSVDAGWQLNLLDQAGSTCSSWDGRGSQRHTEYDKFLRPTTVTELMSEGVPRVAERFTYGGAGDGFAAHNQCGQLIRHDHPAGTRRVFEFGLSGLALCEQMRFLLTLDPSDWPLEISARDDCLEGAGFETNQHFGPSGEMRSQIDAMCNVRLFAYTRTGELKEARLKLAGASEEPRMLVDEICYDAFGNVVSERAGNGITTTASYVAEDGRLTRLLSRDAQGKPLQDLHYGYDPVGNISCIEDKTQLTRHFNKQRIDPVNRYCYNSLYQLIEATGREVSQPSHGPALPVWQTTPLDPNQLRNYIQTFNYDAAGNLQARHHSGAETFEMFTAPYSNRSVADKESLAEAFDANGNQQELLRGQKMSWDIRNQLSSVTLVSREDSPDDTECYFYDRPGHRLRKVRLTQAARRTLQAEVRYLPGLEIHRDTATGEDRHIVSVEAGRNHVRALHWVTKLPKEVRNDQLRYCMSDHLNSSTLELDELGGLLSQEGYYAYGGTAWWVGPGATEAKYKTIRYSGKERDATGLYYYGYRYYMPWLQRWASPDPVGPQDGLNLFLMVRNRPVSFRDESGLKGGDVNSGVPEKIGKWRLEKLQLSYSDLNSSDAVGNNILAHINLSYRPGLKDRLGYFQEMPNLIWREKIALNDFVKRETWSFETDMFEHNPSSRTMEVWPKRYVEAFNSSAGQPGLVRGAVVLHDLQGNKVNVSDLGGETSNSEDKARSVRNYLSKNGGLLAFEIHDVPSISLRENTHKERLLKIQVGLDGAKTTASINQYLSVDTTKEPAKFKRLVGTRSIAMGGKGLSSVDAPLIVSERRPYTKFPGEVLILALR